VRDAINGAGFVGDVVSGAAKSAIDPNAPTIGRALRQETEKRLTDKPPTPGAETATNFLDSLATGIPAFVTALANSGPDYPGAENPEQESERLAGVKQSASVLSAKTPLPPLQDSDTKSAELWKDGPRISPRGAELAGDALWLVADPSPLVARGVGMGITGAARGLGAAAKAGNAGLLKVAPKAAGAVNEFGDTVARKVVEATRPMTDEARVFFGGVPQQAKIIARDASEAGVPVAPDYAQKLERSVATIPFRQNMELQPMLGAVDQMKKVGPGQVDDFYRALELKGPRADIAYQVLGPEARKAVDIYRDYANKHGLTANQLMDMGMLDEYASHALSNEAREFIKQRKVAAPPITPPSQVPAVGGFHKERALPEKLSQEAGRPITTVPEVNAYVANDTGQTAQNLRQWSGVPDPGQQLSKARPVAKFAETDPAKNFANRFVKSAQENEWAKTINDSLGPIAKDSANKPPGYVDIPTNSLAYKVLPGKALPASAVEMILKAEGAGGSKIGQYIQKALGVLWKGPVTALSGPAFHLRNEMLSQMALAGEFGTLKTLTQIDPIFAKIRAGEAGSHAGIPFDEIRKAASIEGTWAGTGQGPERLIHKIRRKAGTEGPQTLPGKVLEAPLNAGRKVRDAAGNLAGAVDEQNRMRAIVGRLASPENVALGSNEARLADAIKFGKDLITYTGEKTPAEMLGSTVMPFVTWTARAAPAVGKRVAQGKVTLPVQIQNVAEAFNNPTPEKYQPRRAREQNSFAIGGKDEAGRQWFMGQPWSPLTALTQMGDPVYEGLAASVKSGLGAGVKSFAQSATNALGTQALPPLQWGAGYATGERPFNKQPLDAMQRATPTAEMLVDAAPQLAKDLGIEKGSDGQVWMTQESGMKLAALPWQQWLRVFNSPTPQETARAALMAVGVPLFGVDPSLEAARRRQSRQAELDAEGKRLEQLNGIPRQALK
jgi:hypothetical protein